MKRLNRSLPIGTLSVLTAFTIFPSGCASFKSEGHSPTPRIATFEARTLSDQALKRFLEASLKRCLEPWPAESWDLPKLTLAALYFRSDLEKASAWQVRAKVRTNLLRYVGAQRRLELLNELSEFQAEIMRLGRERKAENDLSWEGLSAVHTQYANALIARLDALEQLIQSRMQLSEVVGVPVRALLHVELHYDFSRGASNEVSPAALRRLASRNRLDIAEIDRSAAEHRAAQNHLVNRLARLSTREAKRDAVAAHVKDGSRNDVELLLLDARVSAARLAVFDAQVQVQHTLGSLEDAVQQPAELFHSTARKKSKLVSTHE